MISSNDFRPGITIDYNGGIWQIVDAMHVKPGKGSAFVRVKMKNVELGNTLEQTFRAGEKVPQAIIDKREVHYSFKDGDKFVMVENSTFEQIELEADQIGSGVEFLPPDGLEGIVLLQHQGRVIGVELPNTVELAVTETAPDERGDTSSGGGKPAVLETGATVTVPFHIRVGDRVRLDTRTRKYLARA
jgi:elongation factor P